MPIIKFHKFLVFMCFFNMSMIYAQEIPILAFHGVQKEYTSVENFNVMKRAGLKINFSIYKTNEEVKVALDTAELVGVKILIYSDDLVNFPKETVLRFREHPALFGYYISDEPKSEEFKTLESRISVIKKYDSIHPVYVNLYPNYALPSQFKKKSYDDYLKEFTNIVPIDFISFDNYPLMNNKIHNKWYENLEQIRHYSILKNKNFWAFANATVFDLYSQPTIASLKLQMYSNLLYGAQGLQYFTYWTLDDDNWKKNKFGHAIVDSEGNPTVTYDIVKKTNEDIQKYAGVFLGSTVENVFHTGGEVPIATEKLLNRPSNFKCFTINRPVVVSYIKNNSKKYIAILNKSLTEIATLVIEHRGSYFYFNDKGKEVLGKTGLQTFKILPGDVLILSY